MKTRTAYFELYYNGQYHGKFQTRRKAAADAKRLGEDATVVGRLIDGSHDASTEGLDTEPADAGFKNWISL